MARRSTHRNRSARQSAQAIFILIFLLAAITFALLVADRVMVMPLLLLFAAFTVSADLHSLIILQSFTMCAVAVPIFIVCSSWTQARVKSTWPTTSDR